MIQANNEERPASVESLYLYLLYLVIAAFKTDEYSHKEHLSSRIKCPERILHIGAPRLMADFKRARSVGLEERAHDLTGLIAAGIIG